MMNYKFPIFLIFLSFLVVACSSVKNTTNPNGEGCCIKSSPHNVEIQITQTFPYCGGAAPTEEMMNQSRPASGNYILVNKASKQKSTVIADSTGTIYLNLENGEYAIRQVYKDMPFEEFYAKHSVSKGQYYNDRGIECYRKWWKKNLLDFTIADSTTIKTKVSFGARCFAGNNPCLIYTGPYPP